MSSLRYKNIHTILKVDDPRQNLKLDSNKQTKKTTYKSQPVLKLTNRKAEFLYPKLQEQFKRLAWDHFKNTA